MKNMKIMLYKSNQKRDGSYPVCLRISKDGKRKYISLGLSAQGAQWNDDADRFKKDKRVCPNYERDNLFLNSCEERAGKILLMFAEKGQNWSLIQFEEEFCCKNMENRINDIFIEHIDLLKATGHIGNAKKFEGTLRMLEKYDKKIKERTCAEIDFKYVTGFNAALEKRGCCGNTRRIYLKPLSVILNKAIKEKKCSLDTYPFGKGGFELGKLSEVTEKRYLLPQELELIKESPQEDFVLERARRLFLFSYYCFGMSMVDMAKLTSANIKVLATCEHIVYKRHKTQNAKEMKPIIIKINEPIKELLDWFKSNTPLMGDYLLPLITKDYGEEELWYEHRRTRYKRINNNMKKLGEKLNIGIKLTTYVARHTMAMQLQGKNVPREVISQVMGHAYIDTTATYLASFDTTILDRTVNLL